MARKSTRKNSNKRRKSRRRRGGVGMQLKPYPIVPSMRFGCGAFDGCLLYTSPSPRD